LVKQTGKYSIVFKNVKDNHLTTQVRLDGSFLFSKRVLTAMAIYDIMTMK